MDKHQIIFTDFYFVKATPTSNVSEFSLTKQVLNKNCAKTRYKKIQITLLKL